MNRATLWMTSLLLVGAPACGQKEELTQLPAADAKTPLTRVPVTTVQVEQTSVSRPINATGTTEPLRAANLGPQMTARVAEVMVAEGDHVKAGQALVRLDAIDAQLRVQQSIAQAASTKAQYELARSEYERMAPLVARGTVTEQQVARLAGQRDALKSAADAAEVAAATARRDVAHTQVTAPFAGVISKVMVEVGEVATMMPVTTLARLVDLSSVDVRVTVHERLLSQIHVGSTVEAEFPSTGEKKSGQVTFISPEIDARTRSAEIVTRIENADGALRAGMFAELRIRGAESRKGLTVPSSAVSGAGQSRFVYAVIDGAAVRKPVQVAELDEHTLEVLEGLAAGDVIVSADVARLGDGTPVILAAAKGKEDKP